MKKPLVSIIVPIYKVEKYLHICIDSILAQTVEDFELLLIDDGSPDRSGEICDEYAAKDSRVCVFHKDNGGVNSARRLGFENAMGEFLMFVDPDDKLFYDALETLLFFMSEDVNIVVGNTSNNENKIEYNGEIETSRMSCEKYRECYFNGTVLLALWGKLYRRSLITHNVFDVSREIRKGQDVINGLRIAFNNDKDILFVDKVVYFYRLHSESLVSTFKTTPAYEQMYFDCVWESIPEKSKEKYIDFFIGYKLGKFDSYFGDSINKSDWVGSEFYNNLLDEINDNNYKGLIMARLMLTTTNKYMRFIFILFRKGLSFLKKLRKVFV